jgi:hypothetical protein
MEMHLDGCSAKLLPMTFKSTKILQKNDLSNMDFNGAQVIGGSILKPNLIVPSYFFWL